MKVPRSTAIIVVLFIAILAISVGNTYMIIHNNDLHQQQRSQDISTQEQVNGQVDSSLHQLNQTDIWLNQTDIWLNQTEYYLVDLLNGKIDNLNKLLPMEQYDYAIYRYWNNGSVYIAKNGRTGAVDFNSTDAAIVFNQALSAGNNIYVKADDYAINSDIVILNRKSARLDSDGATLFLNQNKIVVRGDDFEHSQNNQISGFTIIDGTIRIENSFGTTVVNMIFERSTVGLELANTNTWTEGTRVDTVHFDNCIQGLVFRTNTTGTAPQGNSTGSYASTQLTRCYFNQRNNSVAITVEPQAEFTDGQMQDVRMWLGEFDQYNQTGLRLDGSMYKTVMDNVVFESFASLPLDNSLFYAVAIGKTAFQSPIIGSGVNILGNWAARIFNPCSIWIYGVGGVFAQKGIAIPIGSSSNYGAVQIIQVHPANIALFKPKITVQGSFENKESITVRFRVEYIDNVVSNSVEKTFTNSSSVWLGDDDFLKLYAYPDMIFAVLVDAKTASMVGSTADVTVDLYGTTT